MRTLTDSDLDLETVPKIRVLIGHRFPNDDFWLSCWIAKKFIPSAAKVEIVLVKSSTGRKGLDEDPSVFRVDTGMGEFDQNGKILQRTCSAQILADKLGVDKDPGLIGLLKMVAAGDYADKLPPTSLHFAIEGFPRIFYTATNTTDWQMVQERVFELFDIAYWQETSRAQAQANQKKNVYWHSLPNGLHVCTLFGKPQLRLKAFEAGAAVVIWTHLHGKGKFYVGIQTNRDYPDVKLTEVVVQLRRVEALKRGVETDGQDLSYIGRKEPVANWFLSKNCNLILSGGDTWELTKDEYTKLTSRQIESMVCRVLSGHL